MVPPAAARRIQPVRPARLERPGPIYVSVVASPIDGRVSEHIFEALPWRPSQPRQVHPFVTNGYYVSPVVARELAEAGLQTVQVSLDGVDAIDHGAVRGCGLADYYRALRAIRVFRDFGMAVYVATLLSPKNIERAPEMAMFCEALCVSGLRYCTFVPTGRATNAELIESYRVKSQAMDEFIAFIRELNARPDARLPVSIDHALGPWTLSGEFQCESGRRVAYITAEGDLYPCPGLIARPFRVGNVFETSVGELLAAAAMSAVRLITREQIKGPCSTCSNTNCRGGCRAAAYATTGDVYGAVSYCSFCRESRVS
jgi:radical SAM protein with 4Fe4S-binding SPASM domain